MVNDCSRIDRQQQPQLLAFVKHIVVVGIVVAVVVGDDELPAFAVDL